MEDKIVRPLPANGCSAELVVTKKAIDDAQDFVWVDIMIRPHADEKNPIVDTSEYDDDPMLFKVSGYSKGFIRNTLIYQYYNVDKRHMEIRGMLDPSMFKNRIDIHAKMNINAISKLKGGD